MTDINSVLQDLHFDVTYYVENRASIADLFKPDKRCGIYILHFVTGEYYVGQAVDVTKRYVQHSKNHSDIRQISFQEIKPNSLNDVERKTIGVFERQGFPIRNIASTSIPKGESDFDLIMPEEAQIEWLNNPNNINVGGNRLVDPNLRRKYERRYDRLLCKEGAEEATSVLREYVRNGIPVIKSSEVSFWGCSCLPGSKLKDVTIYSRINIYWQEVFTVFMSDGKLGYSWHLALTPLEKVFGKKLIGLRLRYPNIRINNHQYKPGGPDQVNLSIKNTSTALKLIKDDDILRAIRLFNLRLMKKGPCVYSRNHCLSLADRLVD